MIYPHLQAHPRTGKLQYAYWADTLPVTYSSSHREDGGDQIGDMECQSSRLVDIENKFLSESQYELRSTSANVVPVQTGI